MCELNTNGTHKIVSGIAVTISEKKVSADEFNYLTNKVGWGTRASHIVEEALQNTLYSVSIYADNKIIGYGRMIGDKTIFLYIQDIMVIPEYQGKKIGTEIMNVLLDKINEYKQINSDIRTYLGASKGKEQFYERFGFKARASVDLGEGMILQNHYQCSDTNQNASN
ncbi:MAG: GNAT family N-acetyltransferase [Clostridium sp.]|nr:GNAT family N-acetyltransferase [Clostridium sp.]MCM1209307.1 GNAT family N-acetyltransferase [Ruminococcus sp.]